MPAGQKCLVVIDSMPSRHFRSARLPPILTPERFIGRAVMNATLRRLAPKLTLAGLRDEAEMSSECA